MSPMWIGGAATGPYKDGSTRIDAAEPLGRTHLPKSRTRDSNLLVVVDCSKLTPHERAVLLCLQGLLSRTRPCIWLSGGGGDPDQDNAMQAMVQCGTVNGYTVVTDWKLLVKELSQRYRGAVVYDPQVYREDALAATIARAGDLIATSADVARELQIPVIIDLRERFMSQADDET